MKKYVFTEEQVTQMRGLLNGITITGIQNAKQVAVIAQVLDAGKPMEEENKEEK